MHNHQMFAVMALVLAAGCVDAGAPSPVTATREDAVATTVVASNGDLRTTVSSARTREVLLELQLTRPDRHLAVFDRTGGFSGKILWDEAHAPTAQDANEAALGYLAGAAERAYGTCRDFCFIDGVPFPVAKQTFDCYPSGVCYQNCYECEAGPPGGE